MDVLQRALAMDDLENLRYLRIYEIIGCRKRGIKPLIPVGRTTWWKGIKSGKYPKPVMLSDRTKAWRYDKIELLLKSLN